MRTPQSKIRPRSRLRQWSDRLAPALSACFATLLALPASAGITLPTEPLTTGARIPPNVLLILDDSGSMEYDYMPDAVPTTSAVTSGKNTISIGKQTYTRNSIFYNPAKTYTPWVDSTGTVRTDAATYNKVYSSTTLASGDTADLSKNVQTYYVPKSTTDTSETYLANAANYYRYQILTNGKVVQAIFTTYTKANTTDATKALGCSTDTNNNVNDWRGCVETTPTGRTEAAEALNYAIWYSYHRTRAKVAKAGAGLAFSNLSSNMRVGFRTIWGRGAKSISGNVITDANPIPVSRNNGLFADPNGVNGSNNNRTHWYDRLYNSGASDNTPLRSSLSKAGDYFSSTAATGPYGPEALADQYTCRQNFTILTTDGYWNNDSSSVGEQDNSAGSTITNSRGDSYTYQPAPPYASSDSYGGTEGNLADVAMRYWKSDLRTDMENNVPTTTANPAFWQHMVTFGISIGAKGTLDPATDLPALTAGTKSWPATKNNNIVNIDDLWHATINGHGSFVVATDSDGFVKGLQSALAAITERSGSFSNVSANSTTLDANTKVFQARYVSGVWTGDVAAYAATSSGTSGTASWHANTGIPTTGRKVFTSDGTQALAFPASATQAQLDALVRTGNASNYPVTKEDNAAYIAGTRSLEASQGGNLRNRSTLLGDIVSSSPAYVSETDTLYVGANDGMLHAIDASNGSELFGFIPGGINWSDLGTLSRQDYSHRYFVDGPVVVSSRTQTPNHNILVGALGKGGKGLFALDVTTPSTFGTASYKWEIRGTDNDVGLIQGKPIIAKLNSNVTALIVSNGVNSTNGHAVLLVYNLDTGELIKRIDTGVGSAVTDDPSSNGLSAPVAWDADGNGTVDYVYAGDMLGNVWKFNLGATTPATWSVANSGNPIFVASHTNSDGTVVRQPITGGMTIAMHPKNFKTWLFFGTGRLMTAGDMTNLAVQSMYGIVDDGTALVRDGTNANLTKRDIIAVDTSSGKGVRAFQPKAALPNDSKGWYIDLVTPPNATAEGERIVSDAQLVGDVLVTSSIIPQASACDPNGRGYLNALDAFSGTSTGPSLFDLNGNGVYTDETITSGGDKVPIGSVDLGVGMPTLANLMRGLAVVGGSSGNTGSVQIRETRNVGRVSWREVKKRD